MMLIQEDNELQTLYLTEIRQDLLNVIIIYFIKHIV